MNIVLDYDGTIHDSIQIYAPAFRKCVKRIAEDGFMEERIDSEDEIKKWIGMDAKTMWHTFMPQIPQELQEQYSVFIGNEMIRQIEEGKAVLYNGAEKVLEQLIDRRHRLLFLSSCKRSYMEAHIRFFGLDRFFERFYCTEDFGFVPKYEIFRGIRNHYSGEFVIVGDRKSDMEIAEKNHLVSIGCKYGYGEIEELKSADHLIGSVEEIIKYI